jgi:hypothetical protein
MASIAKRKDGSTRWDVTLRRRGFATICKSFPTKLAAELSAGRQEDRIAGQDLVITPGTLAELIAQARPHLKDPDSAALRYWEDELGNMPLRRVTPQLLNHHEEALTGTPVSSPLSQAPGRRCDGPSSRFARLRCPARREPLPTSRRSSAATSNRLPDPVSSTSLG